MALAVRYPSIVLQYTVLRVQYWSTILDLPVTVWLHRLLQYCTGAIAFMDGRVVEDCRMMTK